ncbi:MAG: hypothetical protein WBG50_11420 [Desulfomonilaceae bacterium]
MAVSGVKEISFNGRHHEFNSDGRDRTPALPRILLRRNAPYFARIQLGIDKIDVSLEFDGIFVLTPRVHSGRQYLD